MRIWSKIILLVSILGAGCLLGWAGEKGKGKPRGTSARPNAATKAQKLAAADTGDERAAEWKDFAEYRTWHPIHAEPIEVPREISALCAPRSAIRNPHEGRFISVYVNPTARETYISKKPTAFPEGAVIVKAKLREKTSRSPDELGIMVKRAEGFDPEAGDWQFLFVDHKGRLTTDRQEMAGCIDCHANRVESDYVFRAFK